MSASRSLTFLGTPWSVAASVLAVVGTAVFCFIAWRRSGYRSSMAFLELLRLALVALVAILLNQPEWIEEYRPEEKPAIAVLWDASSNSSPPGLLWKWYSAARTELWKTEHTRLEPAPLRDHA